MDFYTTTLVILFSLGLLFLVFSVLLGAIFARPKRSQEISEERITDLLEQLETETERLKSQATGTIEGTIPSGNEANFAEVYLKETLRLNQLRTDALQTLVENYHRQALGQATVQFRISVTAAIIGFLLMIYGGVMQIGFPSSNNLVGNTIAGLSPGFVINLVAGLFFNQARQTRDRGTALYDRLREDQRNRYAVEIADGIPEPVLKSFIYGQIALHIVGIKTSDIDLKAVLSGDSPRTEG